MSSEIDKILEGCINKVILIKLKNHTTIRGNLQAFDQHMNLILTEVEDITEDKVKNLNKLGRTWSGSGGDHRLPDTSLPRRKAPEPAPGADLQRRVVQRLYRMRRLTTKNSNQGFWTVGYHAT